MSYFYLYQAAAKFKKLATEFQVKVDEPTITYPSVEEIYDRETPEYKAEYAKILQQFRATLPPELQGFSQDDLEFELQNPKNKQHLIRFMQMIEQFEANRKKSMTF